MSQRNPVEGLREYNTSTGTILVVGDKNQDFYTWYGRRTPRKIDSVIQGDFGQGIEKRKKRRRNREKRKKKDQSGKKMLRPLPDQNIPALGRVHKLREMQLLLMRFYPGCKIKIH